MNSIHPLLSGGSIKIPLICFLGGLVTSFTPCVYPVIPIFLSIILRYSQDKISKKISASLVFVLGLSITFSVLGLLSSLLGKIFGFYLTIL